MMMQEKLTLEEDAKRKTLLRYVHEIKAKSSTKGPNGEELSATILKLPESGIGDEEVHAIAALLRNNSTVKELQLRGNSITNEGARAVAAILSSAVCQIRLVDLRQNHIGKDGIKVLAEALERNERIKHVYVHAGGKIEALGTNTNGHLGATGSSSSTIATGAVIGVETICVVDVRENDVPTNSSFANADVDVGDELDASVVSLDGGFMLGSITKTSHGPMSKSSSNGVSSALKLKMTAEETLGGSTSSRLFSHRPMSSSTLEKQQKEKKLLRKKKQEEDKKNLKKEAEWNGRAGGIDNSANSPAVKKLPPIGVNNNTENSNNSTGSEGAKSVNRSSSAPVLKKEGEQIPATIDTTVDDAKAALDKAVSSSSLKKDKKQRQTESALMQKLRDSPLAKT
jgi:myosin protein heavy chain